MNKWHRYTQGNKSVQVYVEKFDEFLIRCKTINTEGQAQIMSRFRAGLRDDLRTELLAREVTELEKAYELVQDLDAAKSNSIWVIHKQPDLFRASTPTVSKARLLPTRQILKARVLRTKAKALIESSLN